jgi:hypothetical protein
MVTPHGSFCSSECSVIFREFREKMKASAAARKTGLGLKMMIALFVILGAFVLVHLGARGGVKPLQGLDLVGQLLKRAESMKR